MERVLVDIYDKSTPRFHNGQLIILVFLPYLIVKLHLESINIDFQTFLARIHGVATVASLPTWPGCISLIAITQAQN